MFAKDKSPSSKLSILAVPMLALSSLPAFSGCEESARGSSSKGQQTALGTNPGIRKIDKDLFLLPAKDFYQSLRALCQASPTLEVVALSQGVDARENAHKPYAGSVYAIANDMVVMMAPRAGTAGDGKILVDPTHSIEKLTSTVLRIPNEHFYEGLTKLKELNPDIQISSISQGPDERLNAHPPHANSVYAESKAMLVVVKFQSSSASH